MLIALLGLLALSPSVAAKGVSNPAICENQNTAFFVIDNAVLKSDDLTVYDETSEEDCSRICSNNRDNSGRSILCASFSYDHAKFSCTIYKEKASPVGTGELQTIIGKRYFEKICLPQNVPVQCAESQFIRVDDSVLVGYAANLTLVDSMELCVAQCVQEEGCKSAMFFYEDGECITNKESALSKPMAFTKEENDKVVYFQNGCDLSKLAEISAEEKSSEASGNVEDEVPAESITLISETTPKTEEEFTEPQETDEEEAEYEGIEMLHNSGLQKFLDDEEEEFEEEETTTTTTTTTTEAPKKKSIKSLQKKFKKHPKNFASKTLKALKREKTVKPSRKTLKIKKVIEDDGDEEEIVEEFEKKEKQVDYFSEWSDWTPCTKSGERQIRRRRCLDLRKCLGALMQVQNCPAILPTTTVESVESVRSIVGVDGDDYDDTFTTFQNEDHPLLQEQQAPQLLNEQVWGPWQGTCQQFASSQPCNNGNMIGFESRECIAKDPTQCEGPFFRYCTLSC
ncbi:unnamed protein product [Caenorhabditis bovis]|uniref:Apple domain-containing protein n=1 Tax=Caenorhabditis bovis TaxID=2654633 RepID=A0A8S1EM87_9PELO|nr:unnamed protein product [Caenorhabditis bovis]